MAKAPSMVPRMVPHPPVRAAPPITTAAMAVSVPFTRPVNAPKAQVRMTTTQTGGYRITPKACNVTPCMRYPAIQPDRPRMEPTERSIPRLGSSNRITEGSVVSILPMTTFC